MMETFVTDKAVTVASDKTIGDENVGNYLYPKLVNSPISFGHKLL